MIFFKKSGNHKIIELFGFIRLKFKIKEKETAFAKKLKAELYKCLKNNFKQEEYYTNPYYGNKYNAASYNIPEDAVKNKQFKSKLWNDFKHFYNIEDIEKAYKLLNNSDSKKIYIKVLLYRFLGPARAKLPLSDINCWQGCEQFEKSLFTKKIVNVFSEYSLQNAGFNCTCLTSPIWVMENLFLHQYLYKKNDVSIMPSKGDYVIDGGTCYADNSLCFADMVGDDGKVFCFEAFPDNLKVIASNIEKNPNLQNRIIVKNSALGNVTKKCNLLLAGGASYCQKESSENTIEIDCVSIDDLVNSGEIKKIDFIKLDIEGAEYDTLLGAENAIKQFKPKMAISLYHNNMDYSRIPIYLNSIVPEYKFYFEHYTPVGWESILYATTK